MAELFDPSKYTPIEQPKVELLDPTKYKLGERVNSSARNLEGYNFNINTDRYKRFIDNIYPEALDKEAAYLQSGWSKAGNMASRGILGEILAQGVIGGIGSLLELPKAISDEIHGRDADFTNFLTQFADNITTELEDKQPIFRYNPGKAFDWRDFGWWTESGVSIFSTLGMLIPAAGEAKAAGWISKGLQKVSAAARLNKMRGVSKAVMTGADIMNTEKYWQGLTHSAFAMRNAENMRESSQAYHSILNESLAEFQDDTSYQKTLASPIGQEFLAEGRVADKQELAKFIASKSAWKNYGMNAGNVVFDAMQLAPIFKGFKIKTRTSNILESGKVKTATNNLFKKVEATAESAAIKATSTQFNIYPFIKGGGVLLGEQVSEGVEELVNAVSQSDANWYGKHLIGKEKDGHKSLLFSEDGHKRLNNYLNDPSTWEQAFWGFAGGVAFSGTTHGIDKIQQLRKNTSDPHSEKAKIEEIENRAIEIGNLSKHIKTVLSGINPNSVDGKFEGTDEQIKRQQELAIEGILEQGGYNLGFNASKHGNVNSLLDMIEHPNFKEKFIELGIADETSFPGKLLNLKKSILDAEETYKHIYSKIFTDTTDKPWLRDVIISNGIKTKAHITTLQKERINQQSIASKLRTSSPEFNALKEQNKDKDFDGTLDSLINRQAISILENELNNYSENTVKKVLSTTITGLRQEILDNHKENKDKLAEGDFNVIADIIAAEANVKVLNTYLSANNSLYEEVVNTKKSKPIAEREVKEVIEDMNAKQTSIFKTKLFEATTVNKDDTDVSIQEKIDLVNKQIEELNSTKQDPYTEATNPIKNLQPKHIENYQSILDTRLKYLIQQKSQAVSRASVINVSKEKNDAIENSLQGLFNSLGVTSIKAKFSNKPADANLTNFIQANINKDTDNTWSRLNRLINDPEYVRLLIEAGKLQQVYDELKIDLNTFINNAFTKGKSDEFIDAILRGIGYQVLDYTETKTSNDVEDAMTKFKASQTNDPNIKAVTDFTGFREEVDLATKLITRIINSGDTPLFDDSTGTVTLWFKQIAARYARLTNAEKLTEDMEMLKRAYSIIREAKVDAITGTKYRYNHVKYITPITAQQIIAEFDITNEIHEYNSDNKDYLEKTGGQDSTNTYIFDPVFELNQDKNGNLIVSDKDRDRFDALMNGVGENTTATIQVNSEFLAQQSQTQNKNNPNYIPLVVTVEHKGKRVNISAINTMSPNHAGVDYNFDGKDWTDVILDDINKSNTKAQHIADLLPQLQNWFNLIRTKATTEEISKAHEDLLNADSFGIINEILGKVKPRTPEGTKALLHISKVIFYGRTTGNESEIASNRFSVIENIRNWKSKLHRDYQGNRKIRNTIGTDVTKTITTKITYVTSGSLAKTKNGKLNKLTVIDKASRVQIFITPKDQKRTAYNTRNSNIKIEKSRGEFSHSVFIGVPTPRSNAGDSNYIPTPIYNNTLNGSKLSSEQDKEFLDRVVDVIEELGAARANRRAATVANDTISIEINDKIILRLQNKLNDIVRLDYSDKGNKHALISDNYSIRFLSDDKMYIYDYYAKKFRYERETPEGTAKKDVTREEFTTELGKLNRHINTSSFSTGGYTDILGNKYNNYEEYLIETGAILTDVTQVVDKDGKKLSNFVPSSGEIAATPMAINIDTSGITIGKTINNNFYKFQNEFSLSPRYGFIFSLFNGLTQKSTPISETELEDMIKSGEIEEDCTGSNFSKVKARIKK